MRVLGRSLLLLLLLLPLWWIAQQPWQLPSWLMQQSIDSQLLSEAQPSPVYLLEQQRWLEFVITGYGEQIKVLSNAGIKQIEQADEEKIWRYAIEYQLIDEQDQIVEQRIYHHRSKLSQYSYQQSGDEPLNRYFYLGEEVTPINVASMIIKSSNYPLPLRLKLRLAQSEPNIADVAVRVYQPNPMNNDKIGISWLRLSEPQKERIARGIIYPAEQLREFEIRNLMLNRYSAVGPNGVQGTDYQHRTLYSLSLQGDELISLGNGEILPAGIYADNWLRGIITIPEQGAKVELSFLAVNRIPSNDEQITLRWYGQGPSQRHSETLSLVEAIATLSRDYQGGIVEVISEQPVVIEATPLDGLEPDMLLAGQFYLRGYLSSHTPLEYPIEHLSQQATPLRIDIRTFSQLPGEPVQPIASELQYQLIDQQGQIIKQGRLGLNAHWSHYDRFSRDHSGLKISEPERYFFALPGEVKSIRFISDSPALITAFSRPADLPRALNLPEDNYATQLVGTRQPAWFPFKPRNANQLQAAGLSSLIVTQRRPPEDDPLLLAGQYDWQSFEPQGAWLARQLLQPREATTPLRSSALGSTFRPIQTGRVEHLELRHLPGINQVNPQLIYLRDSELPAQLQVIINGQIVHEEEIIGHQGEVQLPPIVTGVHQLQLNFDEQARWLINYAGADQHSYLKRLAYRLVDTGLTFEYHKQQTEALLSAQLFLPYGQRERSSISIQVEPHSNTTIGPHRHWSFLHRINTIRADSQQPITVLNTQGEQLSDGQRFFIPLGSDLPQGHYRIHITPNTDQPSYLSLYQLTPGETEQRRFVTERSLYVDVN